MNFGFVDGLNKITINVWAVTVIGFGATLVLKGHGDVGGTLITGGFALLRSETKPTEAPLEKLPNEKE